MFNTASGTLSAAVADAGTFTVSYPAGTDEGSFYLAMGHVIIIGQEKMSYPDDFDVTFGTSDITITNKFGSTWASGSAWTLQLEQPGTRSIVDPVTKNTVLKSAYANVVQINLGAPDVLDADGVCESQTVTGAGTAALINGALSDGELATSVATFDVPRCVDAAWTNTAVLTITGTDAYGEALVEVSASGTTHYGKKAFKTITGITTSATITSATVGTTDRLGLPVFLPSAGHVMGVLADGVKLPAQMLLEQEIDQTRLIAGTSVYVLAPKAGYIERMTSVMTTAVNTTGGSLTAEIATVAVVGLTVVVATGSVGDVDTDVPTTVDGTLLTNWLPADNTALEIVGDAAFDSTGALHVVVEVNTQGIFAAGARTAGGATGTAGDVRGTFKPTVACDGAVVFALLVSLPDATQLGMAQYTA